MVKYASSVKSCFRHVNIFLIHNLSMLSRGETRALIGGGGGEYSYLLVLPDEFLLKSAVIKVYFKKKFVGQNTNI